MSSLIIPGHIPAICLLGVKGIGRADRFWGHQISTLSTAPSLFYKDLLALCAVVWPLQLDSVTT